MIAADVAGIAKKVSRRNLGAANVVRAAAEIMVDWTGEEAWRVLIVLVPGTDLRTSDKAALDNLVGIQLGLRRSGDERFAIVEYATEGDLAQALGEKSLRYA